MGSTASSLETLLRQDRRVVMAALVGLIMVSWLYLWFMAQGMNTAGMSMMMTAPGAWTTRVAVAVFLMWTIMMVGMMLPSAAPMILLYAAILRRREQPPPVLIYTGSFLVGYLATWCLFSGVATALQWWLSDLKFVSPMITSTSSILTGIILIAAGIYQWLPPKAACLQHCRSPANFIAEHKRPGASGAFVMGLHHGAYCLGCCWILMLLLFVGGVMNLLWIALLAGFVLIEKLLPWGQEFGRIAGAIMVMAGAVFIAI
jgi:predicted metal-binding membrane protein